MDNKGSFLNAQEKWLLDQLTEYPELQLCEGSFFQRLVSCLHFRFGDFRHPPEQLILHFLTKMMHKKAAPPALDHDVAFHVWQKPLSEIDSDAIIMAQDVNRVVGPIEDLFEDLLEEESIEKNISLLENFKPSRVGDILVSSPSWCRARYLIEVVIYHFEAKRITSQKIIRSTLRSAVRKSEKLKIRRLALDALGMEYGSISAETFARILCETLAHEIYNLKHLSEVIISARNSKHAQALKNAFLKMTK